MPTPEPNCHLLSFSHHQFHLHEREQLSRTVDWLQHLPSESSFNINAQIVLSTCNRLELYYSAVDSQHQALIVALAERSGIASQRLQQQSKKRLNLGLLHHLLMLACGLDSMILGEGQILGQLKKAYQQARAQGQCDKLLVNYFEFAISSAGKIRQQTGIDKHPVSLAYAAVRLAQKLFGELDKSSALIIGAGDNSRNIAQCLRSARIGKLSICNRSRAHGQSMADSFAAQLVDFADLNAHLARCDIIVSSTASPGTLVSADSIKQALRQRNNKPMFIVDLSIPRDIDSGAKAFDDVYLYATDDLQHVLDEHLSARKSAAAAAAAAIEQQINRFQQLQGDNSETLKLYRQQVQQLSELTLAEVREQVSQGLEADAALQRLAQLLSNRIAHGPTQALKQLNQQSSPQLAELLATVLLQNRQAPETED